MKALSNALIIFVSYQCYGSHRDGLRQCEARSTRRRVLVERGSAHWRLSGISKLPRVRGLHGLLPSGGKFFHACIRRIIVLWTGTTIHTWLSQLASGLWILIELGTGGIRCRGLAGAFFRRKPIVRGGGGVWLPAGSGFGCWRCRFLVGG